MRSISKTIRSTIGLVIILFAITVAGVTEAANTTGYAWSENIGWIDASGVTVTDTELEGYLYSGNIGWISLNCSNTDCDGVEYKVTNNQGILAGYAWSENIGWIDMSDVTINKDTGVFSGYAYSGNIGWISFNCSNTAGTCDTASYGVTTTWTVQTPVTRRSSGSSAIARITNLETAGNQEEADKLREQFNIEPTQIQTSKITLTTLIELLISLNIITGENVEKARQLSTPPPGALSFYRDLDLNSEGEDVRTLQQYLISKGYSIPAGATGFFGTQTQSALIQFQIDNNIKPALGYFGPITRGFIR